MIAGTDMIAGTNRHDSRNKQTLWLQAGGKNGKGDKKGKKKNFEFVCSVSIHVRRCIMLLSGELGFPCPS